MDFIDWEKLSPEQTEAVREALGGLSKLFMRLNKLGQQHMEDTIDNEAAAYFKGASDANMMFYTITQRLLNGTLTREMPPNVFGMPKEMKPN